MYLKINCVNVLMLYLIYLSINDRISPHENCRIKLYKNSLDESLLLSVSVYYRLLYWTWTLYLRIN